MAVCPNCGKDAEMINISGQYETGVVAPDGYRETVYEEGYQCSECGAYTDEEELAAASEEPLPCYLDCAMCGAAGTFVIDPHDPSVGYCFKEKQAWVVSAPTQRTD